MPDTRNSKVVDLIRELEKFGARVQVCDPLAHPDEVAAEYGITLTRKEELDAADVAVLAVPHSAFFQDETGWQVLKDVLKDQCGLVADIPALLDRSTCPEGIQLWRL